MYKYVVLGFNKQFFTTLHKSEQSAMKQVSLVCGELTQASKEKARKFLEGEGSKTPYFCGKAGYEGSASVYPITGEE